MLEYVPSLQMFLLVRYLQINKTELAHEQGGMSCKIGKDAIVNYVDCKGLDPSQKHTYINLTPLNPTFI